MPLLLLAFLQTVAAMPENERRAYVCGELGRLDSRTEQLILRALPPESAAACQRLLAALREWA